MRRAKALWHQSVNKSTLEDDLLEYPGPDWCEIESLFSGISPGTERLVSLGLVPEELYDEMRCPYMAGTFLFPVRYGYSLVGRVVKGPDDHIGNIVHVLHPHQDRCIIRAEDAYPVPEDVPARRAILASNMETAVNAVWDSEVSVGDHALVVGFGAVGSLVARLLQLIAGVQVMVVDVHNDKVELAQKMGFVSCRADGVSSEFDVAFHASGTGAGLQTAIDSVGFEGRIVDLSWYGRQSVNLQLGGRYHSRRKMIISSRVSHLPPSHRARWDEKRRRNLVFSLLAREEFDAHLTRAVEFGELPEVFGEIRQAQNGELAYVVTYGESRE